MLFEFTPNHDFNFLTSFAEKFNVPVYNNRLLIPASLGEGNIRHIPLESGFELIIHRYKLNQEFILRRYASKDTHDTVSIVFNNNDAPVGFSTNGRNQIQFSKNTDTAIQVASGDIDSVKHFPVNIDIHYTVVCIKASKLKSLLSVKEPNSVIQTIISGTSSFLFFEWMTMDIEKSLKQLSDSIEENGLSTFYYKIRVEEVLYLIFEKLLKRETAMYSPVNKADIEKLFAIRAVVLADLSKHPRLPELSRIAGLSKTKMKELFKQVFGDSIYNYYQKARMSQAAFLIHHAGYSVSETGRQLGFSNLSHFSRLFKKHNGVNPKKYK